MIKIKGSQFVWEKSAHSANLDEKHYWTAAKDKGLSRKVIKSVMDFDNDYLAAALTAGDEVFGKKKTKNGSVAIQMPAHNVCVNYHKGETPVAVMNTTWNEGPVHDAIAKIIKG